MTGHTEGPWNICWRTFDGNIIGFHIAGAPYGSARPICDASDKDAPELVANAHMLAAAFDMFEAIEQALDDMGAEGRCVCGQAKEMLQAAYAKAGGGT